MQEGDGMDQSRYRDKSYLVTYELTTDIFETFDLLVDDIVPIRSVYILYTDKGVKILKKVNYGLDDLIFINGVMEHVRRNGFMNVVTFMKTVDGNYYMEKPDGIYVVLDLVEGREADYQNPIDLSLVAKSLCRFHNASRGMENIIAHRNNLYSWVPSFEKRAEDLLKFKEIAELHEIKTGFDRLYLNFVDRYYEDAVKSISLLKSSNYYNLCDKVNETKNICHHDLAYHNAIIDANNDVFFVDFDYCILDLRIHDIANLLVKSIKNCGWDVEKAANIIRDYCSIDALDCSELDVLYDFLIFPQDFYEISRSYYMRTRKWDEEEFQYRLENKVSTCSDREKFIEEFRHVCR